MKNQCDGCQAKLPVDSRGLHRNPASDFYGIHMACQRKLYAPPQHDVSKKPLDTGKS